MHCGVPSWVIGRVASMSSIVIVLIDDIDDAFVNYCYSNVINVISVINANSSY